MKKIMLIFNMILFTLFTWTCNEAPPLNPEIPTQEEELNKGLPIGSVSPILSLPPEYSPEGIAIDLRGNMYVSNTRGENRSINEILKFTNNGNWEVYATLPGSGHAEGLVTDLFGNVHVAFATDDPNTNGVYIIKRNRKLNRLIGSENMIAPNALTFDWKGNLYATDSDGGSIWKYSKNKRFEKWVEDPLLVGGIPPVGPPFPLPGANGIAFYPPNKLYVANTMQNSVCCVRIGHDGQALGVELVKQDFLLMNIDGIAVDIHENVYGVIPSSTLSAIGAPPLPPLVRLNPKTGEVVPVVNPENANQFNTPTSIAFGNLFGKNRKSVFISNAALQYGQPMEPWSAPGVVKVYVGAIGL